MPKIFLDSCVVLSRLPRELALFFAEQGLIELSFSQSVEQECHYVAMRKGILVDIAAALIEIRLLAGLPVLGSSRLDVWLPDENDHHVVEGAIAADAEIILTENIRDFPRAALAPLGLKAQRPDELFWSLAPMCEREMHDWIAARQVTKNALKRAKLYRFAKLLDIDTDNENGDQTQDEPQ